MISTTLKMHVDLKFLNMQYSSQKQNIYGTFVGKLKHKWADETTEFIACLIQYQSKLYFVKNCPNVC